MNKTLVALIASGAMNLRNGANAQGVFARNSTLTGS